MTVDSDICMACGRCIENCPTGAMIMNESEFCAVVNVEECEACGICAECCTSGAVAP